MRRIVTLTLSVCTALSLVSCAKAIGDAKDFSPNKPPIVDDTITVTDVYGNAVSTENLSIGMRLLVSITAKDPEGRNLTYKFTSTYGVFPEIEEGKDGCSAEMRLTDVTAGEDVTFSVTATDVKGASTMRAVTVGSGQSGPSLSFDSLSASTINTYGYVTLSFTTESDGFYQVVETESVGDPEKLTAPIYRYSASSSGDKTNIVICGAKYAGDGVLRLSENDGTKKFWFVFYDRNYTYAYADFSLSVDTVNPQVTGHTPAADAAGVSTSATVSFYFDKDIDLSTLDGALEVSSLDAAPLTSQCSSKTAIYAVNGMALGTKYTAVLFGIKDTLGNPLASPVSFDFTTASSLVLGYDGNGSAVSNLPPDQEFSSGESVSVSSDDPVRDGFTFTGWNSSPDGKGVSYSKGEAISGLAENLMLYAQWQAIQYTIAFSANGSTSGSVPSSFSQNCGTTFTVPGNTGGLMKINVGGVSYRFAGWEYGGIVYGKGSTCTVAPENMTLTAQWVEFAVGDKGPAGGWIFYVKSAYSSGWRYMECAPTDQGEMNWATTAMIYSDWLYLTLSSDIGEGDNNTKLIVADSGSKALAAYTCSHLTVTSECGSFSDWFLPSKGEVSQLYSNLYAKGIGNFGAHKYWSSCMKAESSAYRLDFSTSAWGDYLIDAKNYVRAARRF